MLFTVEGQYVTARDDFQTETTMTISRPNHDETGIDLETETAVISHDWEGETSLSRTIVSTIETLSGTEQRTLDRLYNHIDPDSLETIFEPANESVSRNDGQVSFRLGVHSITVHANGTVIVTRAL